MSKPHLLVADPEYIIAMEAERILRELVDCDVTIVNPHSVAERMALGWSRFDAVMLDTGFCLGEIRGIAERLRNEGVPVVFTTAHQAFTHGVPGFPDTPVVAKPYGQEQFAQVLLPLLAAASGGGSHGEIGRSVIAEKPGSGP